MPVVLRVDGFVFGFFAGDHDPAHVHVAYGGDTAIIEIHGGRVRSTSLRKPDLTKACALVRSHRSELLEAWATWSLKREG